MAKDDENNTEIEKRAASITESLFTSSEKQDQTEQKKRLKAILVEIRSKLASATTPEELAELKKKLGDLRSQASLLPSFSADALAEIDDLLKEVAEREEKEQIKKLNHLIGIDNSLYKSEGGERSPQEIDLDVINRSKEACINYTNSIDNYYEYLSGKFDNIAEHSRRLKENPALQVSKEVAAEARYAEEEIRYREALRKEKEKAERSNDELYDRAMGVEELLGKLDKKGRSLQAREQVLRGEHAIHVQRGEVVEEKIVAAKIDVVVEERSKVEEQIKKSEERFNALAKEHAANTDLIESRAAKVAKIAEADKQRAEILERRVKALEKQHAEFTRNLQELPADKISEEKTEIQKLQEQVESEKQSISAELQAAGETAIDLQAEEEKKKARAAKKAKLEELKRKRAAKKAATKMADKMTGAVQNTTSIKPPPITPTGPSKPRGPSK